MMMDARLIYSQWKTGKHYNAMLFSKVLSYFGKRHQIAIAYKHGDNIFSKMKLLYSLSGQDED